MKIAVIGSGILALEAAADLINEGAIVKLIGSQNGGGNLHHLSQITPEYSIDFLKSTTELGRSLTSLNEPDSIPISDYLEKYYLPLLKFIQERGSVQDRRVLRIQKQFLEPNEEIEGHSRFFDLFRVITALNPSGMVEEQLSQNPELEEKIGKDILSSLKSGVESFEDFDVVIDARGPFQKPLFLGAAGSPALNEITLAGKSQVHYGLVELDILKDLESCEVLTLVGSGYSSAVNLIALEPWLLKESGRRINLVTSEEVAFKNFLKSENITGYLKDGIKRIIQNQMESWKKECEAVEEEILRWRGLEPHERMKISPPEFPAPKIGLFEGYTVTSVDRLLDQEKTYLTIEAPPWRKSSQSKELVTLAQDMVFCANGFSEDEVPFGLKKDELGYFKIRENSYSGGVERIKLIKSKLFELFSRAEDV